MEVVRIYQKKCDLTKDLAHVRSRWGIIIHVADHNIVGTRLL